MICHVTIFIIDQLVAGLRREIGNKLDYEWSPFFLRDSGANETRARENHPTQERRDAVGREKNAFLAWGDFYARSRFACSTIPEEKWGLLVVSEKHFSNSY